MKGKIVSKGKAMTQDKTQHHVTFAFCNSASAFCWPHALCSLDSAGKAPGPDSAASSATFRTGTFRTKCAMCHGPDGSGSAVGKSMNVPDLCSQVIQKLPDAQLAQIISDGKGGNAFLQEFAQRGSDSLACSIHSFAASKEIARTLCAEVSQLQADSIPSGASRLKGRFIMKNKKDQRGQEDSRHLAEASRAHDSTDSGISRRGFLGFAAASIFLAHADQQVVPLESRIGVPYRILGRSKEKVSIIGLGGYHLGKQVDPQESIRIIRTGLDEGINFLDNCWDYNGGESEIRMGNALRDGYRQKAFLMSKIDGRTKAAAASQINESLHRLQTDRIDLLQFHEVIRDTDPDRIFAKGGAMEAVLEAQKAGKIRFIGFTGHKSPDIHLKMLATAAKHDFTFDAVQMPLNVMDAHFHSFEKKSCPCCSKTTLASSV